MPDALVENKTGIDFNGSIPQLVLLALIDIHVDIDPPDDLEDSSLIYDIFINPPAKTTEDKVGCRCEILVGRRKSGHERPYVEVSATYIIMIASDGSDEDRDLAAAKLYAATTAWSSFSALFAVINQQIKFEFPPLPSVPVDVDVRIEGDAEKPEEQTDDIY